MKRSSPTASDLLRWDPETPPAPANRDIRYRIVIHINEGAEEKHAAVLRNAANLMTALGPVTNIELVTHGPGIALAVGNGTPALRAVLDLGVAVCVCQNSLTSAKLTAADLIPEARIVPSGMAHLVIRQGEGWAYLRP